MINKKLDIGDFTADTGLDEGPERICFEQGEGDTQFIFLTIPQAEALRDWLNLVLA